MNNAEQAAKTILDALDRGAWLEVAEHIDPRVADRLYAETKERIEYWVEPTPLTTEAFQSQDSDMPDEVAEYLVEKATKLKARPSAWQDHFPGLQSSEEFESMSPREYLARYLEESDPATRAQRELETGQAEDLESLEALGRGPARRLLGVVFEGEDIAHAAYRITWSTDEGPGIFDHVDLLEFHRGEDGWKAVSMELGGLPKNMYFWIQPPPVRGG
jgi:hypothetical protein